MKNATYLFKNPSRLMKNSESRWTAVAQMSLIYISKNMPETHLPVYTSDNEGYLTKTGDFSISNFTCLNTVCESGLKGEIFGISDFDNRFSNIKPDILHIDKDAKKIILIEVKTLSESVARNAELYHELRNYLINFPWKCELLYLLSHGHEKRMDWPILAGHRSPIILWEDLFKIMAESPIAFVIGDSLIEYCESPALRN